MKKIILLIVTIVTTAIATHAQITVSKTGLSLPVNMDPLVFKTNNTERFRIANNGFIGIGTNNPLVKLDVNGDAAISGTLTTLNFNVTEILSTNIMKTNKIVATHPDSLIYIGDSTLVISANYSKIYADTKGSSPRGVAIGQGFIPANGSQNLGTSAVAFGSTAIGYNVRTGGAGVRSIVIGSGIFGVSTWLTNSLPNTLMVGFNSTIPTLFVSASTGAGTTGNVSIGGNTASNIYKLHVEAGVSNALFLSTNAGNGGYGMKMQVTNSAIKALVVENNGQEKFRVNGAGTIWGKELFLMFGNFPDYVFSNDYKLKTLEEVDSFIQENKHLPNIPSAKEVNEVGIGTAELQTKLLEKIEELTLYLIEQNNKIKKLEEQNKEFRKLIDVK